MGITENKIETTLNPNPIQYIGVIELALAPDRGRRMRRRTKL